MKRAVPLLLATLLVVTVASGSAAVSGGGPAGRAGESPYTQGASVGLLGDVSCDGAVSIVDAQLIAQSVAGIIADLGCAANADTDGDGIVTTVDALLIAQLVAGLIERLPADNCVALTLNVGTGQGSIIYTPTNSGGCPANQYSSGTQVTLTATAAPGSVWSSWSGTDSDGTNPTFVMMTGDRTVTANFSSNCVTLTLNVGTGQGSIIYTPTNSGGCPANQYSAGTQVTLTATAAPGSVWSSWSGTDSDGTNPTFVMMTGDRMVTANFSSNCVTLTLNVGTGSGSIIHTPASSGGCPTNQYSPGTQVTLTATAAAGSVWSSWSGTDSDSTNPTFVMMTGDRTVTANFSSNCVTLTLNVGTGQGSIIYTPTSSGGCPANQYSPGTQVTLTASPAAGFAWVSWSGTDSNGTNPTFLIMTGDRTVTVNFQ